MLLVRLGGHDEPRNPHMLKEIIALKALGGLALGGILGAAGLAGLAGFAGAELGGFLGGNCFNQNLEIAVPPATILLNARFIGSAVACQARCFITLNCVNFNYDVLDNVCTLLSDVSSPSRVSNTRIISGPRNCGVLPKCGQFFTLETLPLLTYTMI